MPLTIAIQDTDLATIDVHPESVTDWHGAPRRSFRALRIPGRMGAIFAAEPEVSERLLRVRCMVHPYAHTVAARLAAEDALKGLAYQGLIQIVSDDGTNPPRSIDGVCESLDITPRGHPTVAIASDAELAVRCEDPTWRAVLGSIHWLSTSFAPITLGTAPSGGIIRIRAPHWSANVVNPVLAYYTSGLVVVGSMTFTVTLVAGEDSLEIDLDRQTVTLSDNTVESNGIALLTAGDFFQLDPNDGDAQPPHLLVSASAGTPSGAWYGERRYL